MLAAASTANAGPFGGHAEISYGISSPIGDAGYEETFDTGTKLSVHAGPSVVIASGTTPGMKPKTQTRATVELAIDIGVDRTAMDDRREEEALDVERWRLTIGPRLTVAASNVFLFARFGAGVDRMEVSFNGLLGALCENATIDGLALEGAIGLGAAIGPLALGVSFGASSGDHHDDQPSCAGFMTPVPVRVDVLDNRNRDLDAQLFAGLRF